MQSAAAAATAATAAASAGTVLSASARTVGAYSSRGSSIGRSEQRQTGCPGLQQSRRHYRTRICPAVLHGAIQRTGTLVALLFGARSLLSRKL